MSTKKGIGREDHRPQSSIGNSLMQSVEYEAVYENPMELGRQPSVNLASNYISTAMFGTKIVTAGQEQEPVPEGCLSITKQIVVTEENPIDYRAKILRAVLKGEFGEQHFSVKMLYDASADAEKEATLLKKCPHHESVATRLFADTIRFRGRKAIFIVLESFATNLYDHMKNLKKDKKKFDSKLFLSYGSQIVKGIEFLHRHQIQGRDIKPSNILLCADMSRAKICEFGYSTESVLAESTQSHSSINEGWGAPEVMQTVTNASAKSDIFSAGLTLYYMYSYGTHAFGKGTNSKLVMASNIHENKNMCLDDIKVPAPKIAKYVIALMLSHEPESRPTSHASKKMVELLQTVEADKPCARVKFSYEAKKEDELTVEKNDIIFLTGSHGEHWVHATVNGNSGLCPLSFIETILQLM